jgi:hypothetical protein
MDFVARLMVRGCRPLKAPPLHTGAGYNGKRNSKASGARRLHRRISA